MYRIYLKVERNLAVLRDPKDGKVERRQFDERTYECMTGRMN
jgi:hypothetical protein